MTFNLRYPGQQWDQETGLAYNINRYYDASSGRYIQADPIGLNGRWNRFAYAESNSIGEIDQNGLFAIALLLIPIIISGTDVDIAAGLGALAAGLNLIFGKPKLGNESNPVNAPPGTLPIDQTGLGHGEIHEIKDGIGAGAADWTGIDPDGNAVDNGPADDCTNRPTG